MPIDDRPNLNHAEKSFPNLLRAICESEKTLKQLRRLRIQCLASDDDVEDARYARDLLLGILDRGNWIYRGDS